MPKSFEEELQFERLKHDNRKELLALEDKYAEQAHQRKMAELNKELEIAVLGSRKHD